MRVRMAGGSRRAGGAEIASLSVVAVSLLGCFASAGVGGGTDSRPLGQVTLTPAGERQVALTPVACASGERQLFLGADFLDGGGMTTRLIVDPGGKVTLRFFQASHPLEPGTSFERADCSKLELDLERNGWRINDVYDLRVRLDFDCRSPSGDTAVGKLEAAHCH